MVLETPKATECFLSDLFGLCGTDSLLLRCVPLYVQTWTFQEVYYLEQILTLALN